MRLKHYEQHHRDHPQAQPTYQMRSLEGPVVSLLAPEKAGTHNLGDWAGVRHVPGVRVDHDTP